MIDILSKSVFAVLLLSLFVACGGNKKERVEASESLQAKKILQGIWLDDDGDDVAFYVKGDSVYFPDSTSVPSYFKIVRDSFVVIGGNTVKYHILKQTPHLFIFVNTNGEKVKLYKTDDNSYLSLFESKAIMHVNQNHTIKKDTVLFYNEKKYHCYIQVNPTTYKVIKSSYNDDGVEVGQVYYDNIINLAIYNGASKVLSRDISKGFFGDEVPTSFIKQAVFSDLSVTGINANGIICSAVLAIPETSMSYIVELVVGYNGTIAKDIEK